MGGRHAGRDHRLPDASPLRPEDARTGGGPGRSDGETSCCRACAIRATSRRRSTTDYASRSLPPAEIQPPSDDSDAPYFTSWLRQQLVDKLRRRRGLRRRPRRQSTLDLELQQQVEAIVALTRRRRRPRLAPWSSSTTRRRASWRWSAATTTPRSPFNLATNGLRQPGSSFKPFTLVTALEQGHSTDEVFNSALSAIESEQREVSIRRTTATERRSSTISLPRQQLQNDSYLGSASIADGDEV